MSRFRHGPAWKKTWPVALALAFVLYTILSWNHFGLGAPGLAGSAAAGGQALAAPRPDGGGQAVLGRPVIGRRVQLPWSTTFPTPSAQERQAAQAAQAQLAQLKVPVGPVHHMTAAEAAALRRTAGPPLPLPRPASHAGPLADSDFDVELNQSVSSAGICPACSTASTLSPSVANDGKDLWITGDSFAARSTDNGSTWSYLDPSAVASGMGLAIGPGQQVVYEPSRDTFFWDLTGFGGVDNATNGIGLVTAAGTLGGSACEYPLFPPAFGLPTGSFFGLPDIEYSANYLYLSFYADAPAQYAGSYVARLPLSPMSPANGCGSVTPQYVSRADIFHFMLAQGATDTMYWMSNYYVSSPANNGNHVRVFFWPENSTSYTFLDKTIDPFNFFTSASPPNCGSQDGVVTNWCGSIDTYEGTLYRSRAGYRGFGAPMLGMAWTAAPVNGLTPFPYVVRYYFLLSNMAYKGHDQIYSPNFAVTSPSLAASAQRGYVGGVFTYGGGTGTGGSAMDFYPANGFLIEDPDTPTAPWSTDLFVGTGNLGTWANTNTARAWAPDGLHWIAAGEGGSMAAIVPYLVVFGRGRDHNAYLRWANT